MEKELERVKIPEVPEETGEIAPLISAPLSVPAESSPKEEKGPGTYVRLPAGKKVYVAPGATLSEVLSAYYATVTDAELLHKQTAEWDVVRLRAEQPGQEKIKTENGGPIAEPAGLVSARRRDDLLTFFGMLMSVASFSFGVLSVSAMMKIFLFLTLLGIAANLAHAVAMRKKYGPDWYVASKSAKPQKESKVVPIWDKEKKIYSGRIVLISSTARKETGTHGWVIVIYNETADDWYRFELPKHEDICPHKIGDEITVCGGDSEEVFWGDGVGDHKFTLENGRTIVVNGKIAWGLAKEVRRGIQTVQKEVESAPEETPDTIQGKVIYLAADEAYSSHCHITKMKLFDVRSGKILNLIFEVDLKDCDLELGGLVEIKKGDITRYSRSGLEYFPRDEIERVVDENGAECITRKSVRYEVVSKLRVISKAQKDPLPSSAEPEHSAPKKRLSSEGVKPAKKRAKSSEKPKTSRAKK